MINIIAEREDVIETRRSVNARKEMGIVTEQKIAVGDNITKTSIYLSCAGKISWWHLVIRHRIGVSYPCPQNLKNALLIF